MRDHRQASGLKRPQANYYERRSGRRASQEPPLTATFGPLGANHETTNLGPDKTAWLGGMATKTRPVMELATRPDEVARALAAADDYLLAAINRAIDPRAWLLTIAKAAQARVTDEGETDARMAKLGSNLEAMLVAERDDPGRTQAFLEKVQARLAAVEAAEPHTPEELATLADLAAQREELDEAFGDILPVEAAIGAARSDFPPDVASLLEQDDRQTEWGPRRPGESPEVAIQQIEQRQQGEE